MLIETPVHNDTLRRFAHNGPTMGTRYAAVFYAPAIPTGLAAALDLAVSTVDRQMSTWTPSSDLMRFNRGSLDEWLTVPAELFHVVQTGLGIGRLTAGAFDIGVLDLVRAWGFNDRARRPNRAAIAALAARRRSPAHELVEVDPVGRRLRRRAPVEIDLSGIAKGYGVDRLAETLLAFGIGDFIVSIDGELRAHGRKPDGSPWRAAIEAPDPDRRDVAGVLDLRDAALATSGDYRHRVTLDGASVSHTMDPRTGRPLDGDITAVTIRARSCMLADAWATAVMVMGESAIPLANALGMQVLIASRA